MIKLIYLTNALALANADSLQQGTAPDKRILSNFWLSSETAVAVLIKEREPT